MALTNKYKIHENIQNPNLPVQCILFWRRKIIIHHKVLKSIFLLPNVILIFVMLNEKRINVVFVIYLCMIPFLIYLLFFMLKINMNLYQHAMNVSSMNYFLISSLLITSFNLHSYMKLKFDYSDLSDKFFEFITNEK